MVLQEGRKSPPVWPCSAPPGAFVIVLGCPLTPGHGGSSGHYPSLPLVLGESLAAWLGPPLAQVGL